MNTDPSTHAETAQDASGSETKLLLADAPCFIERQFPVAKVSAESYKERKAVAGQTLTGLGKWWGRKPLVLIRAALLGLLLPATDNLQKDREIFLKLMTMDEEGLWRRKDKSIPQQRLVEELLKMPPSMQRRFLATDTIVSEPHLAKLSKLERKELQWLVFAGMPYSEKLRYCRRPERIDGPSSKAWREINSHLATHATNLPELVEELGRMRFGHRPRVGDSFCGAGSVPFEAARLGCEAYGSDLSPVAALLTWAALNIVGGGEEVAYKVQEAQREIFEAVDRQVTEWGIEHNEQGWRADAYLYCTEVTCPECGWKVPLAPSWVIAEKTNVIAKLVSDEQNKKFAIEIHEDVSDEEMDEARSSGTVRNSRLVCLHCSRSTAIAVVRRNLTLWENDDLVPRPGDVFQERLYCIRWVTNPNDVRNGARSKRVYRAPSVEDLKREARVLEILKERFHEWQEKGYIPSRLIEPGAETTRLQRERGWTHWHHLFTPRQLLSSGSFLRTALHEGRFESSIGVLLAGRLTDWNSRLSVWLPANSGGLGGGKNTFLNQALNTTFNYSVRGILTLKSLLIPHRAETVSGGTSRPLESRRITEICDLWITDPPYADAVNYHELSEFFLAWYGKHLPKLFPDWYTDSKRALAIKGGDPVEFRKSMVAAYRRLLEHMPDNGLQIVMFTHQDASVWADLTLILWAAGLRVTAAWTIATETDSALKKGNYVQGTVLLVCRKRVKAQPVFLDEIAPRVESEVRRQLDTMLTLDDESEPNFGDTDYQLAAYAAALRVLTAQPIEEINPTSEIQRVHHKGEVSPVEQLIRTAVKIACDHLVPRGIEREVWKTLSPMERFYLKGLEIEAHGERRIGVYQELARGFGAVDYTDLLADTHANQTRLKTASELERRMISGDGFAQTLLRQALFAMHQVAKEEEVSVGLNWLRTEIPDYWGGRRKMIELLDYLTALGRVTGLDSWREDATAAKLLAGAMRNDHV